MGTEGVWVTPPGGGFFQSGVGSLTKRRPLPKSLSQHSGANSRHHREDGIRRGKAGLADGQHGGGDVAGNHLR
jgi:hypothetical protein